MKRMLLCCAMLVTGPAMAATGAFAVRAGGFQGEALVSAEGRLRVAPDGTSLMLLGPDRWYRSDWYKQAGHGRSPRSQWFDDEGRLLHEFAGRIRYDDHLQGSDTLWRVDISDAQERYLGAGLADAQGRVHFAPTREAGEWRRLSRDRIVWQGRNGSTQFFSLDGREVLRIDAPAIWVGGPFPGRQAYVICADRETATCRVQDESGTVVLSGDFDEARPAGGNGWWLRRLDTWMRVDAAGARVDQALYQGAALWPHHRNSAGADDDAGAPLEVRRYANGLDSDTPERGWLLQDGRFVLLPASASGMIVDYCPGRWLLRGKDEGEDEVIVDEQGRVVWQARSLSFNVHPVFPWRLRNAYAGVGAAVLDCDGKVLFEQADVASYRAAAAGVMGTLAGEQDPRLWLDAGLTPRLMPPGLRLREDHIAPPLLVLDDVEGNSHLYNAALGSVVAPAFGSVEVLAADHLIFLRDGRYGMMRADGREVLPPIHAQILPLSAERIWVRQDVGHDGAWKTRVALFDGSQNMLAQRLFESGGISRVPAGDGGEGVPGIVEVSFEHTDVEGHAYRLQQWLDRDGQVVVSAVHCRPQEGGPGDGKGVLLGRGWRVDSDPKQPCRLPVAVMQALQDRGGR
ncbi:hypothetical protein [Stenotrophomonas maltophilia]|uniref:hypothetical protein n=1 Tax=Stenotrophomonas maltophilia TaxID=40324 RepID=UPI0020C7D854|nr:hypothetical protein [Stenotrophomonas maltophilia]